MKALVFVARELAELYDEAERLVAKLNERQVDARLIDKATTDLEDLLLVSKYGVVEPFAMLLLDASGVRARLTDVPPPFEVETIIMRIVHSPTPSA